MAESREYKTLRKCVESVRITLRDDVELQNFLFGNYFISKEEYDNIANLSQEQKITSLLNGFLNKVKIAPENYHRLMDYFRNGGEKYKEIVDILEREYLGSGQEGK